jgi:hypothetical protein
MSNDLKASEAFCKKVVGWTIAPNTMNAQLLQQLSIALKAEVMI